MNDAIVNHILGENRKEDGDDGVERPGISREKNLNL